MGRGSVLSLEEEQEESRAVKGLLEKAGRNDQYSTLLSSVLQTHVSETQTGSLKNALDDWGRGEAL